MSDLERFNRLPPRQALTELAACCAASGWAQAVAAGRPYRDVESLVATGRALLDRCSWAEVDAALAAHPRIGEPPPAADLAGRWSRREQAGVHGADPVERAALIDANRAYEQRFGRVFLVYASGRTPGEILAAARDRLHNDEETERRVIRGELGKIVGLRLLRLVTE